jgi:hypothetical protein
MERQTLQRAADSITELLKAHVSDEAEDVDVIQAMAVRDDLREIVEESDDDPEDEYGIPEEGDLLVDPDSNNRYGPGTVRVTGVYPDCQANNWTLNPRNTEERTVADFNPEYDETAPVVSAVYVEGSDKVYNFPVDRLEEM